jgi:hypothetical protein
MKTDTELKAEAFDDYIAASKDGDFPMKVSGVSLNAMYRLKKTKAELLEPYSKAAEEFKKTVPQG